MDGFLLTGREADPEFTWSKLEGASVVLSGGAADMDKTFRDGQGQYVQQQGPFPQQLETDGIGHIVAQMGPEVGPCGFSSLVAMRDWLDTDMAKAFLPGPIKRPANRGLDGDDPAGRHSRRGNHGQTEQDRQAALGAHRARASGSAGRGTATVAVHADEPPRDQSLVISRRFTGHSEDQGRHRGAGVRHSQLVL